MQRDDLYFNEADHTYWVGEKQLPSVTQLLARHGISTDLSGAPEEAVRRAGEHGTFVHEEIENYINIGELGISDEFQDFLTMVSPLADTWLSEVMVWNDDYAGRADLIGITDDSYIIVDVKTGQVNRNAVSWQTSMYGKAFPKEAKKFVRTFCFDAKPDGKSSLYELELVPDGCIDALVQADKRGEIYNPLAVVMKDSETWLMLEKEIADSEKALQALKKKRDAYWDSVKKQMEAGRVTKYESPTLSLTYVEPYSRTTVDAERLRQKYPNIYADCTKVSKVKSSLRVTLKESV